MLYRRINVHENVIARFNNYDRKMKLHVIQKKTGDLVRLQNILWSRVGDAYQSVTYYSPVAQTWIRRKETDDQLKGWFAATVTERKLTELSCCLFPDIPKNLFA